MTLAQSSKSGDRNDDSQQDRSKDLRPESLICRLKYKNTLPPLPFDPKFLVYPLEPSRFLQYVATSLERNYKHELLTETDVGVEVDLIDPDVFKLDKSVKLHPDDERLLEDDTLAAVNARKSRHQKSVSWLRRTEYISTEMYNRWNKSDKVESKLGYSVKRHLNEEIVYRDRESQIAAIEATFEAAQKPIRNHYSKPNVHAVEVLPVLPDFTLWRYPCAQVIFDDDPARKNRSSAEQKEEVNQAMIRGMVDESGDHFVAYFLPTEETKQLRRMDLENRIPYTEGAAYEYELAREYNWNVKNKTMANYEENYFFVFRKDGVFYNELETRVRLSKRRKLNQNGSFITVGGGGAISAPKTRLVVHHRDFTDDELKAQTDRLYMLEHDVEADDEDEDEEGGEDGNDEVGVEADDQEANGASSANGTSDEEEPVGSQKTNTTTNRLSQDDGDEDTDEYRMSHSEGSDVEPSHPAKQQTKNKEPPVSSEEEDLSDDASPPPRNSVADRTKRPNVSQPIVSSEDDSDDGLSDEEPVSTPTQRRKQQSRTSTGSDLKKQRMPSGPVGSKSAQIFHTDDEDEESSDLSD